MAGVAESVLRILAKKMGADIVWSEMISADGLCRGHKNTFNYLEHSEIENPFIIQIFGSEAEIVAQAAQIVSQKKPFAIDINMGCPVRKVVKRNAGSGMMKDPDNIRQCIKDVRKSITVPLSVKFRLGINEQQINYLTIGKIAEQEGCDFVTLHPRTQVQVYTGNADWNAIQKLKNEIKIPVIGSGDITSATSAKKMQTETGCDALMIGRHFLKDPFIFYHIKKALYNTTPDIAFTNLRELVTYHAQEIITKYGEYKGSGMFRKHLAQYSKGLTGSNEFRRKINSLRQQDELLKEIDEFFPADNIE